MKHRHSSSARKRPTLADVARLAGVSKMTVSVVLNGARSNTRVSEATRLRIEAAARELGYHPNLIAQALGRQRTGNIGFYSTGSFLCEVPFVAQVFTGLQKGCAQYGQDLLLHGRFQMEKPWPEVIYNELDSGKIDGLIICGEPERELLESLLQSQLKLVSIVRHIHEAIPSVVADERLGMRLLVDHLIERGHQRIIYRGSQSQENRYRILCELARQRNLTIIKGCEEVEASPLTEAELRAIRADHPATAMICAADYLAYPVLAHASRLGLRVPDEFAVVGFDGIQLPLTPQPKWRLTTITAHWDNVAWKGVELLTKLIDEKEVPRQTVLPVSLIQGETT